MLHSSALETCNRCMGEHAVDGRRRWRKQFGMGIISLKNCIVGSTTWIQPDGATTPSKAAKYFSLLAKNTSY